MNSFVVILSLSCLAAVTFASPTQDIVVEFMANGRARCRNASCGRNGIVGASCPPTNCPPRQPPASCGTEPDCNIVANRAWHHVHWDPNFFWQCAPYQGENDWRPVAMPCACGTLFVTSRNRCQHPHEWAPECPGHVNPPVLAPCDEDCGPVCDGDGGNGNSPTTQAPPIPGPNTTPEPTPATEPEVEVPVTPAPPGGNCPCICIPCIFWPCSPCTASRTGCPCSQNQQQRPQPQPQPLPEPPRNNPWAPPRQPPTQWVPEAPRQPPTQWVPEQPRQPEWQPPRIPEQPRQPEWQPPRIPQQPPTNWQPQPQPPQQWQPQPPQNNPWQRPFVAEDEEEQLVAEKAVEDKEEEAAAEDEAL